MPDADPWGHSIKRLIDDLYEVDKAVFTSLNSPERDGRVPDRFCIPTRYPNGLPDITPNIAFTEEDADACLAHANNIIGAVKALLKQ